MESNTFTPFRSAKRGGFTLIEILIVIGIIVLLMGITTQMLGTVGEAQGRAKAKSDMALIATGIEAFFNQYDTYPRITSVGNEKQAAGGLNRPQERMAAEHTGNTKQKKETEVSLRLTNFVLSYVSSINLAAKVANFRLTAKQYFGYFFSGSEEPSV